jgi:ribosomal protein S27E
MLVPCVTIEDIADSWSDFYAETSSTGCASTLTNPMGGLAKIFSQIAGKLGPTPRLIPNGVS